ncbi:hypothetical protein [Deinococcus cellulosilyticus]|uniref:Uncharacterized protein n=1 Tax=Deinococcus cellulosilyticus (strain DSM 18568 / NBRC 106333 / KACC 11606 / 5516J-15) TaxID=1223518 RepID=A0A511MZ56_DEIC1|nr:hypothetical protein [Deinococcus cellulosilyticus]GEM45874.1 hypothetical protein DC3_15090 [Deinococcus cellulosilyticus NBRC 106333 = KACC 11606]
MQKISGHTEYDYHLNRGNETLESTPVYKGKLAFYQRAEAKLSNQQMQDLQAGKVITIKGFKAMYKPESKKQKRLLVDRSENLLVKQYGTTIRPLPRSKAKPARA